MDIREEFIKEKSYSYFNNTVLNEYAIWLEQKLTEKDKALQLQQTGVSGSNCCKQCKKEIDTPFRFCSPECKQYYYR